MMMEVQERIIFILLYLMIAAYGLLALGLIAQAILDLKRKKCEERSSIRSSPRQLGQHIAGWHQPASGKNANREGGRLNRLTHRLISEEQIEETLNETFPANDPPAWTLGIEVVKPMEWVGVAKIERRSSKRSA
jgi:hypothetical protein